MTYPNDPFFIAGCVRSGTTLLRRILVRHPHLECPEETHFFRWADPFGSLRFSNALDTKLLHKHRAMDGVGEEEFREIVSAATNRRQLAEGYARCYMRKQGNPDGRWFDKTPQNVYGLLLLRAVFPEASIVHIHRHPLNVVASLLEGKVMPPQPFAGALNYWVESAQIFGEFSRAWPQHLIEVSYEELTTHPRRTGASQRSRPPGAQSVSGRALGPASRRGDAHLRALAGPLRLRRAAGGGGGVAECLRGRRRRRF
jgi:hypothetical protein